MLNGDNTNQRIRQDKVIGPLLQQKNEPRAIIEHLYLRALCRPPTAGEMQRLETFLASAKNDAEIRETLHDIFWAILNSKEFLFNH
jgi:hypothetical protein